MVSFLRIFHDRPERNVLEGRPARFCVKEDGSELSLIATESTLRAMLTDLASLQLAGKSLCRDVVHAEAFSSASPSGHPLPPARLRVQQVEHAPASADDRWREAD